MHLLFIPQYVVLIKKPCSGIMKDGGQLIIAEVKSRFASSTNTTQQNTSSSMEQGIESFTTSLDAAGFTLESKEVSNQMFVLFVFKKEISIGKKRKRKVTKHMPFDFKACRYKKR